MNAFNGRLQVRYAPEDATDSLVIQVAEPSLDKIQPTGIGGDEVRHKPRIPFLPRLHLGMLVRPVVVHDQMQGNIAGELGVDAAQDQELLMAMPLVAFTDDLACKVSRAANRVVVPLRL